MIPNYPATIRRPREHVVSPEEQVVGGMAADHCAPGETVSPPTPLLATSPPSAGGNQQFQTHKAFQARNTNTTTNYVNRTQ